MSLVQDLADQLRFTRDELPVAHVAAAVERYRTAAGLLAWVMHHSGQPSSVPSLTHAADCLEHATAALRVAQDAIDEYAVALGVPVPDGGPDMVVVPAQIKRTESQLTDWWAIRVAELSGETSTMDQSDGATSSSELLIRCARAALENSSCQLHRQLVAAGPAVGLGLAAIAPPLLYRLATDLVGHPPRLEDLARLRRAGIPIVAELLPALPAAINEAAEEIIGRVCRARPSTRRNPCHPVDLAASSVLLVAGLLRANGNDTDRLVTLMAEPAAASDEARSPRATLRITDDRARRRSAVDELGRAAQNGA